MGVNNKQRRAAKARKRRQAAPRPTGTTGHVCGPWCEDRDVDELAGEFLVEAIERISTDLAFAGEVAARLLTPGTPLPTRAALTHLRHLQAEVVSGCVRHGWSPNDLVQTVTRQLDAEHVPHMLALVTDYTRTFAQTQVGSAWAAELEAAGPARLAEPGTVTGLTQALAVAGVLLRLPPLPPVLDPPGAAGQHASSQDPAEAKVLARVRALLSKAESTEFAEEAEALSAKAQELISRHSLDRLLHSAPEDGLEEIASRRLWIDAPYVVPKAQLIQAVAQANRCRAIASSELGFSTLMGLRRDLDAVEMLVTSLLVQVSAAMLQHGRHVDRTGRSRTTSFRQSFLISYAHRIGERLEEADAQAVSDSGRGGEVVKVIADLTVRVDAAMSEAFPQTTSKAASVSNHQGWLAGRDAADRAQLDPRQRLTG